MLDLFFYSTFNIDLLVNSRTAYSDKDAKRLLDDLLNNYDSIVRPVINPNDQIKLSLGIKLSQIADIVII